MSAAVGLSIVPGLNMTLEAPDMVKEGEFGAKATLRLLFLTIPDKVKVSGSPSLLVPTTSSENLLITEDTRPGDPWEHEATSAEELTIVAQAGDLELKGVDRFGLVAAKKRVKVLSAIHFYITIKSSASQVTMYAGPWGYTVAGWLVESFPPDRLMTLKTNRLLVLNAFHLSYASPDAPSIGAIFPMASQILLREPIVNFRFSGGIHPGIHYIIDHDRGEIRPA